MSLDPVNAKDRTDSPVLFRVVQGNTRRAIPQKKVYTENNLAPCLGLYCRDLFSREGVQTVRPNRLITILVLLALAVPAPPAYAGGIVSICDEAHLLAALADDGTVTFSCSGTISLTAAIVISADTILDGSGQTVTISGNHAVRVFTVNSQGTLTLNKLTIADGYVAGATFGYGGGIYNYSSAATVSNSTFSGNSGYGEGGGIATYGALTLKNTIVANNRPGGNCLGTIPDGGGNLSYPGTTCPGINGDPLLGPLQNNGGPTETLALGRGSAAIDAANDAICDAPPVNNRDQRGIVRPQGSHCDIGAVEQQPYPPLPSRMWLPTIRSQ